MITIDWNKKQYTFPEQWDELTEKQFLVVTRRMGKLLFETEVTEQDLYAQRIIALQEMLGVPLFEFKKLLSSEIVELLDLLDFTKKVDINKQLIPKVSLRCGLFKRMNLIGPKAGLDTSTFDEFIMADTYFVNISEKKSFDQAYYLFAFLYRPKRKNLEAFKASDEWDGDEREPFNATKCMERVELLKKYLPKEYLVATMYFYWGFREKNLLVYKTLFPAPKEDEETPAKKKHSYGWADTRLELSGHKFGNFQETGNVNWRNIIFDMHREQEKRTEREKQMALARLKSKRK